MTYSIIIYKWISQIVWILNSFDRYHLQSGQVLLKEKYKILANHTRPSSSKSVNMPAQSVKQFPSAFSIRTDCFLKINSSLKLRDVFWIHYIIQFFTNFQSSKTYSKILAVIIKLYTGELLLVFPTFKSSSDAASSYFHSNSSRNNPDQLIELC
jgi:hypothetical protein